VPFNSFVFVDDLSTPTDIGSWVRLLLTGSASSTTPDTATLNLLTPGAIQEMNQRFPACLTFAPGGLLGDDLAAYNEAVGAAIAAKLVLTPGGQQWARYVASEKIGTVTETYHDSANSQAEANQALLASSSAALSRITCVREALAAAPRPGMLTLSGRRRSLGCGG
jgi:hypothetical protein